MTKSEKLFELYQEREQAIRNNYLNDINERDKLMKSYMTIITPEEDKDKPASTEAIRDIQQASGKMWAKFDELDKPRVEIQAKIDALIKCHNPKVIEIMGDEDGWSVLVEDKREKFSAWVNVWIDTEYNDVMTEWNNDIFYTDYEDDVWQMLHQNDATVYEMFTSEAIYALADKGYIYQNDDGEWLAKEDEE